MTESTIFQLLERLGVSVVVLLWFMLRHDKKLDANTDATNAAVKSNASLHAEAAAIKDELAEVRDQLEAVRRELRGAPEPINPERSRRALAPKPEDR